MKLGTILMVSMLARAACAGDAPPPTVLYKSVGPDGRIVYGDRPPADGRAAQTMKLVNAPSSPPSAATLAYLEQLRKGGAPQGVPTAGELVLFTASWCGYCRSAKAYLGAKNAPYKEIDIESRGGAAAFAQAGGQRGVPLLVRDKRRVQGFSAPAYDELLRAER